MFVANQRKKLGVVRLEDIYYASEVQPSQKGCDALYYFHSKEPGKNARELSTLHIDLSPDEDTLFRSFNYQTRKSIRKMLDREDLKICILDPPEPDDLDQYSTYFNQFASIKNIWSCSRQLLDELLAMKRLVLIKAMVQEEVLCQYVFFEDGDRVVVYAGCTARLFEPVEREKLQLICDAHRMMDYQSMLYFKKKGMHTFDFCGLSVQDGETVCASVNQYKLGFGGTPVKEYHFMNPITLRGKLFCWMKARQGGLG